MKQLTNNSLAHNMPYQNRENHLRSLMIQLQNALKEYIKNPMLIRTEEEKEAFISIVNDIRSKSKPIDIFFKQNIPPNRQDMDKFARFKEAVRATLREYIKPNHGFFNVNRTLTQSLLKPIEYFPEITIKTDTNFKDIAQQIIASKSDNIKQLDDYAIKFNDFNKFENLIITIVKICIANISVQGKYYANFAIIVLDKYADKLEAKTREQLIRQLIKICVAGVPNGGLIEIDLAIMVLDNYTNELDQGEHTKIITGLIEDCIARQNYNTPKLLLENRNFLTSKNKIIYKNLIINTIKLCIDQNNLDDAEKLLNKNKKLLEPEDIKKLLAPEYIVTYKKLVINLVKKSIDNNKIYSAEILLIINKDLLILEDQVTYREIQIHLIKNYINNDSRAATKMLKINKEWLILEHNVTYREIVSSIFRRVTLPTNSIERVVINKLLKNHIDVINTEDIRALYTETNSIETINLIREYVVGPGAHRRINLPPRHDILVQGAPLQGIAFEVHNYTDGIENVVFEAIKNVLDTPNIKSKPFTTANLMEKFSLIKHDNLCFLSELKFNILMEKKDLKNGVYKTTDNKYVQVINKKPQEPVLKNANQDMPDFQNNKSLDDDILKALFKNYTSSNKSREKAHQALTKILASEDYKIKLEKVLPTIAYFLDEDNGGWNNDYKTADSRWQMWLTQSFVEAGTAYNGNYGDTSCVKGIYERLFTGFRAMHPVIDALFAMKNFVLEYDNKKDKELCSLKDVVLKKLKEKSVAANSSDFEEELKAAYSQVIKERLTTLMQEQLEPIYAKLDNFPKVKAYILEYIKVTNPSLFNKLLEKFKTSIDNIKYIPSDNGSLQTVDEYINKKLSKNT